MAEWWEAISIPAEQPQQQSPQSEPPQRPWYDEHLTVYENTGQSQLSSMVGAVGQGALSVPAGVVGGLGALGEVVGLDASGLRRTAQAIEEFGQEYSPVNPIYAQSFPVEAAGAVGQAAAQLATLPVGGLAGRAIGGVGAAVRGAQVAGLGSAGLMGSYSGQQTADRLGIENRAQRAAMILGQAGIELGTEMLGGFGSKEFTQGILGRLADMPWKRQGLLNTALSEGGEEMLAGTASPLLERAVLMGEAAPSGEELTPIPLTSVDATLDLLRQGALGAVAGGFMGGVSSVLNQPDPKAALDFRLRAKARINELENAPQLTEEESRELETLKTEDQNAAQWLETYGERTIYEPLRQVIDPASDWRNERARQIAETEDEAERQRLLDQTNEEIRLASEALRGEVNPFSVDTTTAALDEALTPPPPDAEDSIREVANDPVVVTAKEVANEVEAAGAPATARVLAEQADVTASQTLQNVEAMLAEARAQQQAMDEEASLRRIEEEALQAAEAEERAERLRRVQAGEDLTPPATPMEDLLTLRDVVQQERQRALEREQREDQVILNDVIAEQRRRAQEREQQQPIVTDEPNIQEAVSGQQEVRQDVQESRELPVVQERPTAQAQETTIDSQGERAASQSTEGTQQPQPVETQTDAVQIESSAESVVRQEPESSEGVRQGDQELQQATREGKAQGEEGLGSPSFPKDLSSYTFIQLPSVNETLSEIKGGFREWEGLSDDEKRNFIRNYSSRFYGERFPGISRDVSISISPDIEFSASFRDRNGRVYITISENNVSEKLNALPEGSREGWLNSMLTEEAIHSADLLALNRRGVDVSKSSDVVWNELLSSPDEKIKELIELSIAVYQSLDASVTIDEVRNFNDYQKIQFSGELVRQAIQAHRENDLTETQLLSLFDELRLIIDNIIKAFRNAYEYLTSNEFAKSEISRRIRDAESILDEMSTLSRGLSSPSQVFEQSLREQVADVPAWTEERIQSVVEWYKQGAQGKPPFGRNTPTGYIGQAIAAAEPEKVAQQIQQEREIIRRDLERERADAAWSRQTSDERAKRIIERAQSDLAEIPAEELSLSDVFTNPENLSDSELLGKISILRNNNDPRLPIFEAEADRRALPDLDDVETGATVEDLNAALKEIQSTEIGRMLFKDVIIVDDIQGLLDATKGKPLPPEAYELLRSAEGFFRPSTGETYIILDNVFRVNGESYKDAIKRVIFHERVFHGGLRWMYAHDPSFARKIDKIYSLIPESEREALMDYPGVGGNKMALVEEWMARTYQQQDPSELAKRDPIWKQIWEAIKDFVARIMGYDVSDRRVDRLSRRVIADILNNKEAFGNQSQGMSEDLIAVDDEIYPQSNEIDRQYLEAVQRGDLETAQRIVNEAAEKAGGIEVFHSGDIQGNVIDVNRRERGALSERRSGTFYGSTSEEVAKTYPGKLNRFYFFLKNPYKISTPQYRPVSWDGRTAVRSGWASVKYRKSSLSIGEAVDRAKRHGYDGVIYGNIVDLGRYIHAAKNPVGDTVVAFNPNQIKSADPVTYDDQGNIILPSRRFRDDVDDIRFSIPYSQREAQLNLERLRKEAGLHPDMPDDLVRFHQILGQASDQPYVVQRLRPQIDFIRSQIWNGGVDENGVPKVNEENTRAFWRQNDKMTSDPNWAIDFQDSFRDQARASSDPELRNNNGEAIGSIAQMELMNYAQLMMADKKTDAQEALEAVRRGRYVNDITLLRYATISGAARAMQVRSLASRGGQLGFWNALNLIDEKKDQVVSKKVGKKKVKKLKDDINKPKPSDIDTEGVDEIPDPEPPSAQELLGIDEEAITNWRKELEQDGVDRLVDAFFRGGDQRTSNAGPLIQGSNWLNTTLSQLMNEQLDAMGIKRAQGEPNPSVRERIIRELGLNDLKAGKIKEFDSRLNERLKEIAVENPEVASKLREQWEIVSSALRTNAVSGATARRAIHEVLNQRKKEDQSLPEKERRVSSIRELVKLPRERQLAEIKAIIDEIVDGVREQSRMEAVDGSVTYLPDSKLNATRNGLEKAMNFMLSDARARMAKAAKAREERLKEEEERRPTKEVLAIIDKIDQEQTEWIGPDKKSSPIQAVKKRALADNSTDEGRPNSLTREQFIQFYQAELAALGVDSVPAYTLASRLYDENKKLRANAEIRRRIDEANRPTKEAQAIIDRLDETQTEWIGPDRSKSRIRRLKEEAVSTELTDTSRPGHLTREQFIQRYSSAFEALGVNPVTANALSSRLYDENMKAKANRFIREMDSSVAKGSVKSLAEWLLADPVNSLNDPARLHERMVEWLQEVGLTEEQASKWAKRHHDVFREKLIKAKEKAFERAIKGMKGLNATAVDNIRRAIRAGALDPDNGVRDAIAAAYGAKNLSKEDLQKMAVADLRMRDADGTRYMAELSKIRDVLGKVSPDPTWTQRITSAWMMSVLSGVGTVSLGATVPFFASASRLGLQLSNTLFSGIRGIIPKGEVPSAILSDVTDFINAYKDYITVFRSTWKNDEVLSYHRENIYAVDNLKEDLRRQLEIIKNGSAKQKVAAVIKASYASTDIIRRVMNALDGASMSAFENLFFRQEARNALRKVGVSSEEITNAFTQATLRGKEEAEKLYARGEYDEDTSARIANDLAMDYMQEFLAQRLSSAEDAQQIRDFARRENQYELGVTGSEDYDTWDVFQTVTSSVQSLAQTAQRKNQLVGRLLFGFTSLPLALANRSLNYTPYGLLRVYWKNKELDRGDNKLYLKSMGNSLQIRQRKIEAIAGTILLLALAALQFSGDDDDENYTGIKITLNGPKDPGLREAWLKKGYKPNSIMWVQNGKPVAGLNFARGTFEALKLPLIAVGAIEDMRLNGELGNGDIANQVSVWAKSAAGGGLEALAFAGLKNAASVMGLADMKASDRSIASQIAFTTSGFVPWSGFLKSLSRPITGSLDQSSAQAAVLAQFPITSLFGSPSLNYLGDQRGSQPVDIFSRVTDRSYLIGLPLQLNLRPDSENAKAYELFVSKGVSPSMPSRSRLTQSNGLISDEKWRRYVKLRGEYIKRDVYRRYTRLSAMDRADFENALGKIVADATKRAKREMRLQ